MMTELLHVGLPVQTHLKKAQAVFVGLGHS